MKPRFNLALVPESMDFSRQLTTTARAAFGDTSRGYLLGPRAIPHMTVCQFRADDDDHARRIARTSSLAVDGNIAVAVDSVYFRPRPDLGTDFFNAGLLVTKTPEIEMGQHAVHQHIEQQGGEPLTAVDEGYWPHFTMAYTNRTEIDPSLLSGWAFGRQKLRPVLGHCDENGQLLNVLWQPA